MRASGVYGRAHRKWICGHMAAGHPCRMGPNRRGRCGATFECAPARSGGRWQCRRVASCGGQCSEGPLEDGSCSHAIPPCRPIRNIRTIRGMVSRWAAVLTFGLVVLAITYAGDPRILIPGPLSSGHSTIANCSQCHSNISDGRFAWLHALVKPASTRQDATACQSCHKVTPSALQPHGQALDQLKALTDRRRAGTVSRSTPISATLRNAAFPTATAFADGVFCATCHKEHQGDGADLTAVSSQKCQACHVVQFRSFADGHPDFGTYPFVRRTRTNFDHVSHFGEHFPKNRATNSPSQPTPEACSDCHVLSGDARHMDVKPFNTVCSACHLHQIAGTDNLSGHQGVSFLSLPGLDIETLARRNVRIGEWPAKSEARLTPFMKLLIGRDEHRGAVLDLLSGLDLMNLSEASDGEILAVEWLAWEVKTLIDQLSKTKPSDTLQKIATTDDAKPDQDLHASLTAHLPRDVLTSAIREWLPNLDTELAGHRPIELARVVEINRSADALFKEQMSKATRSLGDAPDALPTDQTDPAGLDQSDILSEDETGQPDQENLDQSDILDGTDEETPEEPAAAIPETEASPKQGASQIDAQTWAEFGGWYRQDFAILYKPTGHADGFFKAWLDFTAGQPGEVLHDAASKVFTSLTDKNARGQCTKCHSIDENRQGNRQINWGPATSATKTGRFTGFSHEPHFGFPGGKGCLTCHQLDETADYQKGFADHDPSSFSSNFKPVRKDQCTNCHTDDMAGTDCLTCHEYHVYDVTTPIMTTKVPEQ